MAKTKLLGTLALLLALTVGIVACDDGSTGGGGGGVTETAITASDLEAAIAWFNENASAGKAYYYSLKTTDTSIVGSATLDGDENPGTAGSSIRLIANAATTVTLSSGTGTVADLGSMFTIGGNAKLIIGNNVTLQGFTEDDDPAEMAHPLVTVGSAGLFEMVTGSKITGVLNATGTGGAGAAVLVAANGSFTMSGGEISGNESKTGGSGVYVKGENATFTLKGGEIKDNVIDAVGPVGGAGVFVEAVVGATTPPVFTMSGGKILGITDGTPTGGDGGGVYLKGASATETAVFNMTDGEISGNNLATGKLGGGVYVGAFGVFTQDGDTAVIKGNKIAAGAASAGGGVYVAENGSFTLKKGVIGANEANLGGGVALKGGTNNAIFIMEGGTIGAKESITSNVGSFGGGLHITGTAEAATSIGSALLLGGEISGNEYVLDGTYGGGAYVGNFGKLTLAGGTISGNKANFGGGVAVDGSSDAPGKGGVLAVADGAIKKNRAQGTDDDGNGGGIYLKKNTNYPALTITTGGNIYASASTPTEDDNLAIAATGGNLASGGHAVATADGHIDTTTSGKLVPAASVTAGTTLTTTGEWFTGIAQ
jgi:hypothetical protein